ncbi:hypothetical protein A6U92_05590 [Agrobacterium rubi]|nr:hypothetical protein A6U92_05590 [Agrobacterium rubi]
MKFAATSESDNSRTTAKSCLYCNLSLVDTVLEIAIEVFGPMVGKRTPVLDQRCCTLGSDENGRAT